MSHTQRLLSLVALFFLSLSATACFSSPKPECAFACGDEASCPSGYRCVSDGWCKRDDVAESFTCSAVSLLDGATSDALDIDAALIDAASEDAALVDAAVDATPVDATPIDAAVDADIDAAP